MALALNIPLQQQERPASMLSENEPLSIRSNNIYDIMSPSLIESNQEDDEDDDMNLGIEDGSSSMSSSPSIPDENINFDLVYALHTFTATVEGQASVVKGDALILMEDTNIYWWLVEVLKTQEIGYIPAENIETPYERLARLNKHRNVDITTPFPEDNLSAEYTIFSNTAKKVTIADDDCLEDITFFEVESDLELEDDDDLSVEIDGDDDDDDDDDNHTQDTELDMVLSEDELQQTISPKESSTNNPPSNSDECKALSTIEQQQKPSRTQQQQRPQRYLTPAHFKNDMSSQYLSGEGSSLKRHFAETHNLRVFGGNIGHGPLFHTFNILATTTTEHLLKDVTQRFKLTGMEPEDQGTTVEYYITVQGTDGDEYILAPQDKPCSIFKTLTASLTTPMPTVSQNVCRKPQEGNGGMQRKRSNSFGNQEQTSFEEDSVIRFYVHRRIKQTHHERQGVIYIKVSLYPDEYVSASDQNLASGIQSTFFKNNNNNNNNKKKTVSTTTTATVKTEIDRIDKILTVSYDTLVGTVINTALEKFHIPDAVPADNLQPNQSIDAALRQHFQKASPTIKYAMSIRNGNGQDCMADVLHEQRQISNHISSSDYLFILRRCHPVKQNPSSFRFSSLSRKNRKAIQASSIGSSIGNMITGGGASSGARRPSILDMLTDYSPVPSAEDRRPNYRNSNPQVASPESIDRRRTNHSKSDQQDRSSSLDVLASGSTSLKQQLKRLVTWGSTSSSKLKNVHDLTISTSPSSTSSFKSSKSSTHSPSQLQQQQMLPTPTTFVPATGSRHSLETQKDGCVGTKPTSMVTRVAVKSQYIRPQNENGVPTDGMRHYTTPSLDPSPKTYLDSQVSEASLSTMTSSCANSSGVLTSKHSPPEIHQHNVDEVINASCSSDDDDDEPKTLEDHDTTMKAIMAGLNTSVQGPHTGCHEIGQSSATNEVGTPEGKSNDPISTTAAASHHHHQQDRLVDSDLFFLVTQGVDFLKTKEGTKWEEDEDKNGYQYHPWNWSPQLMDSSDTITLDTTTQGRHHCSQLSGNETRQENPPDPIVMDKSLTSPPLSPLPTVTQLKKLHITNQEKKEKPNLTLPSIITPKESPVNDEELQWIVNSHILF
ncbi:hypothetical protein BCR42DRAFT_468381 [Absidia repens]|uniref:SH3 domain-containing protein n=1 Tax=Absidia repens TaxID=90262 RepID=A0A1X2IXT4_9FUNG|nr:hypothetical protein BCR42DRAFT_468381 [Absidia repens]